MKLEYLIKNIDNPERCRLIIKESQLIDYECRRINDESCIISAIVNSESEEAARKLSDLNTKITHEIPCTVLANESAAYFNKKLYPIVNDFERKLRRLLYTASSVKADAEGKDTISNLEEKDFGELFELLFLDKDYQNAIKSYVNADKKSKHKWTGYAFELENYIESNSENPLWDRLLIGEVPTLRTKFLQIKNIRNDVMHAHNIDKIAFVRSKTLFIKVNNELDEALEHLANGLLIPDTYNLEIEQAIERTSTESEEESFVYEKANNSLVEAYRKSIKLKEREDLLKELDIDKYNEYKAVCLNAETQMEYFAKRAGQIIEQINAGKADSQIGDELAQLNAEAEINLNILSSKPVLIEKYITQAKNKSFRGVNRGI